MQAARGGTSVALVHDYLTQRGGAERVVLAMTRGFPGSPLHTSLFEPTTTFSEFSEVDVRPFGLNRVALLRRHHRAALPVLPIAFSMASVDAAVTLCSSSGWAHGVRTTGRKVVYCYTPARWLYDAERYADAWPRAKMAVGLLRRPLTGWDRRAAATADRYITLSRVVRDRIFRAYGIEAEVLPPPPALDVTGERRAVEGLEPGFFLCVARLLPYKNVDAVVAAFRALGPKFRLIVVGTGPEERRLRKDGASHVRFLGAVADPELRWLYAMCRAVVAASYEDYGLTPLEGAAFGKPSAVLRGGGFLDTVVEGETGTCFDAPDPTSIECAVRELAARAWSEEHLTSHAAGFSEIRFLSRLREIVDEVERA